ncbi:hypothetical protein [Deinococcus indicus]|uniref:hypothetical protein n=1 Tax=Deinococcus indicus TaxID=223556 RepID=UPI0017487B41|nr:hypothetical protein [Deinococcus indicus]
MAWVAGLGALLAGVAGADVCEWPAEVMDVRVGASGRGEWLVRRAPDQSRVWVERGALRGTERGYVERDLPCPDGPGELVRAALTWTVDEGALQLTFTPNVTLLPRVTVQPEWPSGALPGGWAVVTVPVSVQVSGNTDGQLRGTLGLRPAFRNGPVSLAAQLDAQATAGQVQLGGAVSGTLRLPETEVGVRVQRDAAGTSAAAHLNTGRVTRRTLPPLTVPVPLGGVVSVQIDGNAATPVTAAPGTVVLTGIPLPDRAGQVQVTVSDEAGTRTVNEPFPAPLHALNAGDWRAGAEATLSSRGAAFQVRAAFAAGSWMWATQGLLSGTDTAAGVSGTFRSGPNTLGLTADTRRDGRDWQSRFGASYRTQGVTGDVTWSAGLHGAWGTAPQDSRAGVEFGLGAARWQVRAAGDWTPSGTQLNLGGQWQARPDLRVRAAGQWSAQRQTWQLGVTWQAAPTTTAELLAGQESALNVTYRPAQPWTVQAQVTPRESRVGVTGGVTALLSAAVTSRGAWQAGLSSVLVSTGGINRWSRSGDSGVVAVQTGIPNLPLQLDGAPAGRTDAGGTLLLPGVTPAARHILSVQVDDLPIEVLVREDRLTFTLQDSAGAQLDWRSNFTRLRALTFLGRSGEPATFGTVRTAGQEWLLDGDGRTLLPAGDGQGQLFWDDQSCPVTWKATEPAVTCS